MILTTSKLGQKSLKLSELGDRRAAQGVLGDLWRGPGVVPQRDSFNDEDYAWAVLACAVLTIDEGACGGRLGALAPPLYQRQSEEFCLFGSK